MESQPTPAAATCAAAAPTGNSFFKDAPEGLHYCCAFSELHSLLASPARVVLTPLRHHECAAPQFTPHATCHMPGRTQGGARTSHTPMHCSARPPSWECSSSASTARQSHRWWRRGSGCYQRQAPLVVMCMRCDVGLWAMQCRAPAVGLLEAIGPGDAPQQLQYKHAPRQTRRLKTQQNMRCCHSSRCRPWGHVAIGFSALSRQ